MTGHRMSFRPAQDWIGNSVTRDCVRGGRGVLGIRDDSRALVNLAVENSRSRKTREKGGHQ